MGTREVSGEHVDDSLVAIEQHVEHEVDSRRLGDRPNRVVHGVADSDAPGGVRIADAPRIVERERRLEPRKTGSVQLRPAAEAGKEVRLDEPGGDADVRVDPLAVEPHGHVHHLAAELEAARVASVVVHDPHALEHVGAEHRLELGRGVSPMGAGGNEHHDVVGVHDALELVEHGRDHQMPRLRSGAVAHRDRNRLAGTHASTERSAHRRAAQRGEQRSPLVGHCLRLGRRDNDRALARHVDLHAGLSVCEPHLHRGGAYDRVRHSVLSTVTS